MLYDVCEGAVIRPFNKGSEVPNIVRALSKSSVVMGQLLIKLFCSIFMNASFPGKPIFCCNFRANSASLTCFFWNKVICYNRQY